LKLKNPALKKRAFSKGHFYFTYFASGKKLSTLIPAMHSIILGTNKNLAPAMI
jgi:hypothetical protein